MHEGVEQPEPHHREKTPEPPQFTINASHNEMYTVEVCTFPIVAFYDDSKMLRHGGSNAAESETHSNMQTDLKQDSEHPLTHMLPTLGGTTVPLPIHVRFGRRLETKHEPKLVKHWFRTFDGKAFCPWCMQSFDHSTEKARQHIRAWHAETLDVAHHCAWPFDFGCELRGGALNSSDEVVDHMAEHLVLEKHDVHRA
ncbi:hypothetical protein BC835DRAFT_1414957 [Cytidiella melzeri]|nr:hypothetical protein BC835DRAFT_1414957 [Cytidiella melzeri]